MALQGLTAAIIREQLLTAPPRDLAGWRQLRRGWSRALKSQPPSTVVEVAIGVLSTGPWGRLTAYELIACHPTAATALTSTTVRHLGRGLGDWGDVDAFACYVAGPAWREGRLASERSERQGRNPQTGEAITIAASKGAKFTPGKAIKTALNGD